MRFLGSVKMKLSGKKWGFPSRRAIMCTVARLFQIATTMSPQQIRLYKEMESLVAIVGCLMKVRLALIMKTAMNWVVLSMEMAFWILARITGSIVHRNLVTLASCWAHRQNFLQEGDILIKLQKMDPQAPEVQCHRLIRIAGMIARRSRIDSRGRTISLAI